MIILLYQSLDRCFYIRSLCPSPCLRSIIMFHFVYVSLNLTCESLFSFKILKNLYSCLWTSRSCGLSGPSPPVLSAEGLNEWIKDPYIVSPSLTQNFDLLQNADHLVLYWIMLFSFTLSFTVHFNSHLSYYIISSKKPSRSICSETSLSKHH